MPILLVVASIGFLLFSFIFLIIFGAYVMLLFAIPMLWHGAVFANSSPRLVQTMIELAQVKPGDRAVDLGSGDGRLVIALAQAGVEAHGYEINPLLVVISRRTIQKLNLSDRAFVHWQSFWKQDLSGFSIVTVYGISYIMRNLEAKLQKELTPKSRVVSNYFIFSRWRPTVSKDKVFLYTKE